MDAVVVGQQDAHGAESVPSCRKDADNPNLMSEEAQAAAAPAEEAAAGGKQGKKGGKGKLIVILLLAVVLGGGGFFGLKIMRGGKKAPEAPKVGKVVALKEFLVNLSGGKSIWLKTEIALGVAEGKELGHADGAHEGAKEDPPEVRDAINMLLMSKSAKDLATMEGKKKLKEELIETLNQVLNHHGEHPQGNLTSADNGTHSPENKSEGEHKEGTNQGPVLEVYFISFAMQEN